MTFNDFDLYVYELLEKRCPLMTTDKICAKHEKYYKNLWSIIRKREISKVPLQYE